MTALLPIPWNSNNNSVPIDVDEAATIIKNSRRRHVIAILDDVQSQHSADELAEGIAAIEMEKEIPEVTSQERKRVYISLYQHHLEKLHNAGTIVYDERSKDVYPTDATAAFAALVEHIESVCED